MALDYGLILMGGALGVRVRERGEMRDWKREGREQKRDRDCQDRTRGLAPASQALRLLSMSPALCDFCENPALVSMMQAGLRPADLGIQASVLKQMLT